MHHPDCKLLLFDYDGVLANSLPRNLACVSRACKALGYDRTPSANDVSILVPHTFQAMGLLMGIPEDQIPDFIDVLFRELGKDESLPGLFAGMDEVLYQLSRWHHLGIVTTNAGTVVQAFLKNYVLEAVFDGIYSNENPGEKADHIREAAERWDFGLADVVMIGDTIHDVEQGKQAGVTTVAVGWGFHGKERVATASPDHLVLSPSDLLRLFTLREKKPDSSRT